MEARQHNYNQMEAINILYNQSISPTMNRNQNNPPTNTNLKSLIKIQEQKQAVILTIKPLPISFHPVPHPIKTSTSIQHCTPYCYQSSEQLLLKLTISLP